MELHSILLVPVFLFSLACARNPVVDLGYARYRGQTLSSGVNQWLGIRYAAPPVGPLRFAAPQDPRPMEGIQYASKVSHTPDYRETGDNLNQHGPICIPTGKYPIPQGASEDCLFLDVYAPAPTKRRPRLLPVYVWIQGGGYNENSQANYNGTGIIQASHMDIVVVTFNYRVGPYGFLSGEEVLKGGSLNNGLKDHIKVLQWVQKHIRKVCCHPDNALHN